MTVSATRGTQAAPAVYTGGGGAQSSSSADVRTCMEHSLKRILTSSSPGTTTTTSTMPTRVSTQPTTTTLIPSSWTYTESPTQPETKTGETRTRPGSSWLPATTTREDRTRQWVEESTKRTARDSIEDVRHLWTQSQGINATGEVLTNRTNNSNNQQPGGINNRTVSISGMEHFQKVDSNSPRGMVLQHALGNVKLGEAPSQVGNQPGKAAVMAGDGLGYSQHLYRQLLKSGRIRTSANTGGSSTGIPHTVTSISGQQHQQQQQQQQQQHEQQQQQQFLGQFIPPTTQRHHVVHSPYQPTTSPHHQPTTSPHNHPTTSPHHHPTPSPHQSTSSPAHSTTSQGPTLVSSAVHTALRTVHGDVTNPLIPGTQDMDVSSSDSEDDVLTEHHLQSSPTPHSEQLVHTETESDSKETLRKQILRRNPHVRSTKAKSQTDKLTPEEERRRAVRRQRNKEAAQRCRSRRTALSERLFKEYQDLECKNTGLKYEVRQLEKEQAQLETILQSHVMRCKLQDKGASPTAHTS